MEEELSDERADASSNDDFYSFREPFLARECDSVKIPKQNNAPPMSVAVGRNNEHQASLVNNEMQLNSDAMPHQFFSLDNALPAPLPRPRRRDCAVFYPSPERAV